MEMSVDMPSLLVACFSYSWKFFQVLQTQKLCHALFLHHPMDISDPLNMTPPLSSSSAFSSTGSSLMSGFSAPTPGGGNFFHALGSKEDGDKDKELIHKPFAINLHLGGSPSPLPSPS